MLETDMHWWRQYKYAGRYQSTITNWQDATGAEQRYIHKQSRDTSVSNWQDAIDREICKRRK